MSDERHINGTLFFSTAVAANRLGITPAQVRKRCKEGTLQAQKVGNTWFVALPEQQAVKEIKASTPSRVVSTIASVLPSKPIAQLPVVYAKSLPMVIGVVVSIALFFVGTLPFMSESIASFASVYEPIQEVGGTVAAGYEHFVRKTDELLEYSSLSVALGVGALQTAVVERVPEPRSADLSESSRSRMSSLGRSLAQTPRVPVHIPIAQGAQQVAAAAASLYQFERLTATEAPFTDGSTWGCILGFTACTGTPITPEPPMSSATVIDSATNEVYCVGVIDGQLVSTPGGCTGEAQ